MAFGDARVFSKIIYLSVAARLFSENFLFYSIHTVIETPASRIREVPVEGRFRTTRKIHCRKW